MPRMNFSTDEAKAEPNHRQITSTILNHDYTATEPRWQSTIDIYVVDGATNF